MLALHVRASTIYLVMFLATTFVLAVFIYWVKNPQIGRFIFNKVRLWPLVVVFIAFFGLEMHMQLSLNYPYTSATSKQTFWHNAYIGLAAHPTIKARYGITYSDAVVKRVLDKGLAERYYGMKTFTDANIDIIPMTQETFNPDLYNAIIREAFLKVLKNDPLLIFLNYTYKIPLFILNYFGSPFGSIRCLLNWKMIAFIFLGCVLCYSVFLRRWLSYFSIIGLGLTFSLLPVIITMPMPWVMADPALLFTLLLYMLVAAFFSYIIKKGAFLWKDITVLKAKQKTKN
jgi:hypothetical protein